MQRDAKVRVVEIGARWNCAKRLSRGGSAVYFEVCVLYDCPREAFRRVVAVGAGRKREKRFESTGCVGWRGFLSLGRIGRRPCRVRFWLLAGRAVLGTVYGVRDPSIPIPRELNRAWESCPVACQSVEQAQAAAAAAASRQQYGRRWRERWIDIRHIGRCW
jgi:hypothetical protein